jgi:hypothetical protein
MPRGSAAAALRKAPHAVTRAVAWHRGSQPAARGPWPGSRACSGQQQPSGGRPLCSRPPPTCQFALRLREPALRHQVRCTGFRRVCGAPVLAPGPANCSWASKWPSQRATGAFQRPQRQLDGKESRQTRRAPARARKEGTSRQPCTIFASLGVWGSAGRAAALRCNPGHCLSVMIWELRGSRQPGRSGSNQAFGDHL